MKFAIWEELKQIPPFNPDDEAVIAESSPVTRFREAIREADVVLFSTPEYAHGIPGVLKNALDWVVGSGELSGKPAILVNASSRGVYAQASLREILKTMDARLLSDFEITLELLGKDLEPEAIARDLSYATPLNAFLEDLAKLPCKLEPSANC